MADSVLTDVRRGKYSKPGEGLLLLGSLDEDFFRTPKYGIATQAQAAVKKSRYKARKSIALWLEVLLAGYFGWMIVLAGQRGQWGSIPFLLLFFGGFAFVAGGSLLKRFSMERFQTAPAAA